METYETKEYKIIYPKQLERFILLSVKIATEKRKYFCDLFDCKTEDIKQLKASFFISRDDFVNYIKSITNGKEPPEWAIGCFYNGEIQTLENINNEDDFIKKKLTLIHETLHLFFENLLYKKYKIGRIRWLDESYACFLDGHIDEMNNDSFCQIAKKLKILSPNFDMNILNDIKKIKSELYNGYDMFLLIGKYIFDKRLEKILLEDLKTDPKKIVELGKTILNDAVNYLLQV